MKIESRLEYSMFFDALFEKLNKDKYLVVGTDNMGRRFDVIVDTNSKKRLAYRYLALKLGFDSDGETNSEYTIDVYKQTALDEWALDTR